jgi:hypothetical protein
MVSGKAIWYITGNNGKEKAIEIVEKAKTKFSF